MPMRTASQKPHIYISCGIHGMCVIFSMALVIYTITKTNAAVTVGCVDVAIFAGVLHTVLALLSFLQIEPNRFGHRFGLLLACKVFCWMVLVGLQPFVPSLSIVLFGRPEINLDVGSSFSVEELCWLLQFTNITVAHFDFLCMAQLFGLAITAVATCSQVVAAVASNQNDLRSTCNIVLLLIQCLVLSLTTRLRTLETASSPASFDELVSRVEQVDAEPHFSASSKESVDCSESKAIEPASIQALGSESNPNISPLDVAALLDGLKADLIEVILNTSACMFGLDDFFNITQAHPVSNQFVEGRMGTVNFKQFLVQSDHSNFENKAKEAQSTGLSLLFDVSLELGINMFKAKLSLIPLPSGAIPAMIVSILTLKRVPERGPICFEVGTQPLSASRIRSQSSLSLCSLPAEAQFEADPPDSGDSPIFDS